jgi:ABC-2 type transport system ATP-binding protein/lipopolysaccharide transport system ATP-binding protein
LLIDEVLAVGDAAFVPRCLDRIDDFRRRQKTILFVSHDLNTVGKICDRVAWLKNGRVQMIGEPKRVVDAYLQDVAEKQERAFERRQQEPSGERTDQEERRENRWGKREIEITRVSLKNAGGQERRVFTPEEGLVIEMDVVAHSPAKDFVFGIGLFNSQGICCYATNTELEDYEPVAIQGEGKVVCRIETLSLVNGTYYLDVAVHKRDGYPYDYHRNLYSFLVSSPHRDEGIGRLDHGWDFSPGIIVKPPRQTG